MSWKLRKQQPDNTIYKIKNPVTKKLEFDLEGIQKAFEKYYQNLYDQPRIFDSSAVDSFLTQLDLPSLGAFHNEKICKPITTEKFLLKILQIRMT